MKIKITEKNNQALIEALQAANKGCSTRKVEWYEIHAWAEYCESRLEKYSIPKKCRAGSQYKWREAINCNSYGNSATATAVTIVRGSTNWYLVDCARESTGVGRGHASEWFWPSEAAVEYLQSKAREILSKLH